MAILDRLRRDPGAALLVLALAAAAAIYAPALGRGLVNYDDPWLYADNHIVQDASPASLRAVFCDTRPAARFALGAEYLPVRDLSVMLDYQLWGSWYGGFHLTNLIVYLAAIALWFAALVGFGVDRRVAGVMALVWALHPTHAESVAWLSERKGVLGAMFAGAAALGYARFRAGRPAGWLVLAALAGVAAVWSKAPSAFALAALAALELVLPGRPAGAPPARGGAAGASPVDGELAGDAGAGADRDRADRPGRRRSWRRSALGLAVIGGAALAAFVPVLAVARGAAVVGGPDHAPAGPVEMAVGLHGFYLQLAAMTVRNSASYAIHLHGPSPLDLAVGAAGLIAAAAVAVVPARGWWRPPGALRAAALIWLIAWLPASRIVLPLRAVLVADRYLLLPTLGVALAVAVGLCRLRHPRLRALAIAAVAALALVRAVDAQSAWRDAEALWQRALEANPDDGDAWNTYAELLVEAGRPELAEDAVARGLARARAPRLVMRAALLVIARDPAHGRALMREAAEAGEPRAQSNLALLLLDDRQLAEALDWGRRGAGELPMYAPAHRAHGKVALAAGRPDEALGAFERAYALQPRMLANRYNLALALLALDRPADARGHLVACLVDRELAPRALAALAAITR